MEKRILTYKKQMEELLEAEHPQWTVQEWEKIRQEHLVQISFFQHERLVHLIVTVVFALLTVITVLFDTMYFSPGVTLLVLALLLLLIPYIRHYYILENTVQKMYEQYDKLAEKTENK